MKFRVSVIVVTYNRSVLLDHCLKSLSDQTFSKDMFEVIVINDGSSDNTGLVTESYFHSLNLQYYYQEHGGIGTARNFGIKKAKSELVAFIDDDCFAAKSWLKELLRFNSTKISAAGGKIKVYKPRNLFEEFIDKNDFSQNWQPTSSQPPFLATANSIFKKDIIEKIGGFDPSFSGEEDLDLGWRLFFNEDRFEYLPRAVIYHVSPRNLFHYLKKSFLYGRGNAKVSFKHQEKLVEYRKLNSSLKINQNKNRQKIHFLAKLLNNLTETCFNLGFTWQNHLISRQYNKKRKIKIATIYRSYYTEKFQATSMDTIRWLRISEGLASLGYRVDMITNESDQKIIKMNDNLRRVPYKKFRWHNYDVIKTLFQSGFESLEKYKGIDHPFIISKTTVVGRKTEPGILFYGSYRDRLFRIQEKINKKARFVTVLNEPSKKLWKKEFGDKGNILLIPTGVDKKIPPPAFNPYRNYSEKIVFFAGYISDKTQKKLNVSLQNRLNRLGKILIKRNIRLCFVGDGDRHLINPNYVTYLGCVENQKIWDFQHFAGCGIILADNEQGNFEASKIYYYLRSGLPVVSESPIPNNYLINEANLGYIAPYNQPVEMAKLIEKALSKKWDKENAIKYMIENHTWEKRVQIYDGVIKNYFKL